MAMEFKIDNVASVESKRIARENGTEIDGINLSIDYNRQFQISTTRAGGSLKKAIVEDGEIVEVELSDGSVWYVTEKELKELHRQKPTTSRGESTLVLDNNLFQQSGLRGNSESIISVTMGKLPTPGEIRKQIIDWLTRTGVNSAKQFSDGAIADLVAAGLGYWIDHQNDTRGTSTIRRINTRSPNKPLQKTGKLKPQQQPWLLFIHGTFSSTRRAFGGIWESSPNSWKKLVSQYGDRIIALEHRTLTESPIQNALAAVQAIPAKAKLHVVSHSRGGLVGELLCRGHRSTPFNEDELELIANLGSTSTDVISLIKKMTGNIQRDEHVDARELNELLKQKSISVDRFIRVGCPARGTTLASARSHRWLNTFLNVMGMIPAFKISPMYAMVRSLLVGFVKSATKASVLPGLHAQSPTSGLIRVLNATENPEPLKADLSVVSGTVEANSWYTKLPMWLANRFYGGDNDLVVNTASMDGGALRKNGILEYQTDSNHLKYFSNSKIVKEIEKRLTSDADKTGQFKKKKQHASIDIPSRSSLPENISTDDLPILVLLPGIMGSTLQVDDKLVWINYWQLMMGGLAKLRREKQENDDLKVVANGLHKSTYAEFVHYFRDTHHVVEFPYDWRNPLTDSANKLKELLAGLTNTSRTKPIRIVAHSMGGLVVRMLISNYQDQWESAMQHEDSRFIMAGTPTNGSFGTLRTLVGQDRTIRSLALLDTKHDLSEVMKIVRRFPGLLSLLPIDEDQKWLRQDTWDDVDKTIDNLNWNDEDNSNLKKVARDLEKIKEQQLDPEKVFYVAGIDEKTPCNATIENDTVRFEFTDAGDGQVTWMHGIPRELTRVWYQPSTHGALLSDPEHFLAWEQIVKSGATDLLASGQRTSRTRDGQVLDSLGELPPDVIDYLPNEQEMVSFVTGAARSTGDLTIRQKTLHPLDIAVAHGDLRFSSYPVAVGHYEGDSIIHAERVLDENLDGRLTRRFQADRYPGPLNSCEVLFATSTPPYPEGALVVGLGRFGTLTGSRLEQTLTSAIKQYIIEWNELPSPYCDQDVTLSTLLVGSGMGGVSINDSLQYLIDAARTANLQIAKDPSMKLLRKIEILELWEDLAHEAVHHLVRLRDDLSAIGVNINSEVQYRHGGLRRPFVSTDRNWWDTISVRQERDEFIFNNFTRYARSEITRDPIKIGQVDKYIDRIVNNVNFSANDKIGPHRTLFEMVLPNYIKENSLDTDKLRLILDRTAARIPWEMLIDGWADNPEPLAIKKQMVRQLSVDSFELSPQRAEKNLALVIGDPPGPRNRYPALPGALEEAKEVVKYLEKETNYKVVPVLRGDLNDDDIPTLIRDNLMSQEYKIMHIAAHGYFNKNEPEKCGMIIGPNDELFTANDVKKIRRVPTFVFLNCCHLGLVEEKVQVKPENFHRIAANLATTFIQRGVKAVIAAGWAVDDAAAKYFAEKFYQQFVTNRETFGRAVQSARKYTYEKKPNVNTFGAYQAWGDPDFSLRFSINQTGRSNKRVYVSTSAYEIEAHNIRQKARAIAKNEIGRLCEEANDLRSQLFNRFGNPIGHRHGSQEKSRWNNPATKALAELARAYGELGCYDQAILLLHEARRLHVSALSFRDLEQLANFECRYAIEVLTSKKYDDEQSRMKYANALARHGISLLKSVVKSQGIQPQSTTYQEIHCLIGSASRRMAVICTPEEVDHSIIDMRKHYGQAWIAPNTKDANLDQIPSYDGFTKIAGFALKHNIKPIGYAFTNYLLGVVAKGWIGQGKFNYKSKDARRLLKQHAIETKQRALRATHFWNAIGQSDFLLIQLADKGVRKIVENEKSENEILEEIRSLYSETRRRFGSARQWLSIFDQVLFIRKMLEKANDDDRNAFPFITQLENELANHAGKGIHRPPPMDSVELMTTGDKKSVDQRINQFLVSD